MCKNAKTKKHVVPCYLWLLVFPPLFLGTFPIWFKTSTLKENCLSNYCWGKKRKKKTNISPFPATHTYIKLTFVSFFFNFFILNLSLSNTLFIRGVFFWMRHSFVLCLMIFSIPESSKNSR